MRGGASGHGCSGIAKKDNTRTMKASTPSGKRLLQGFHEVADAYAVEYLSQWTFDRPFVITAATNRKMHRIQKSMYKAICHFAVHYDNYRDLMPVPDRIVEIVKLCKDRPYQPGTYRTDYVVDENKKIKLIEITCRFALNGLFISGFFHHMAHKYISDKPGIAIVDDYSALFDYFMNFFGEFEHICLLQGPFDNNEAKYALPIFEQAGIKVHRLRADELSDNVHLFKKGFLISEFGQDDWCTLSDDTIMRMIDSKLMNDPRTIFLIHDKRFFSVLGSKEFLKEALTEEEAADLLPHIVPTYRPDECPDHWADARQDKDGWIVKPFAQGRSIDVHAGCCTTAGAWEHLFASGKSSRMVLQPFVRQRTFPGEINGRLHEDYAAGILLFFNDNFFGPGVFRASSFPVTNKVDDRKFFTLVTDDISDAEKFNII